MNDELVGADDSALGNLEDLKKDIKAAIADGKPSVEAKRDDKSSKPEDKDDKLPEKLRGKSREDIAEMYLNLESSHGRMANDLGQQRKLTDRLLDLKRETDISNNSPAKPPKVSLDSTELLNNPSEAIERVLSEREKARDAEQATRLAQLEQQIAAQAFVQRHPDFQQYANSKEFSDWIAASPIRQRAAQAAQQGDWSVAGDLLSEFKGNKAASSAADEDSLSKARKATTERVTAGNGDTGKKSGKIYKRADVLRLRIEQPHLWDDENFSNEILRAYNEGRVK